MATRKTRRKETPWIAHVKKVAKDKGISYIEALKVASATYISCKDTSGVAVEEFKGKSGGKKTKKRGGSTCGAGKGKTAKKSGK